MAMLGAIKPLLTSRRQREVLVAVTAAYMLVQLSSMPVALSLPTLATEFGAGIDDTAWIVTVYLLMLGSFVLLGARMGDRFGHERVFALGIVASLIGSVMIAVSSELWQIVGWRGVTGFGSAMIMGNANAILAVTYPENLRGRAFAMPIVGARFATLLGMFLFAAFLQFFTWRLVFLTFLPMGIIAAAAAIPMIRSSRAPTPEEREAAAPGGIDWLGGILLVVTAAVLVLSGSHLHAGEESFTSPDGLTYHLPMHGLFLALLAAFVLVEWKLARSPIVELRHFREKYFSMSLISNTTFHFSMLATMTLVPILVEEGFGQDPIVVPFVLLPNQVMGVFVSMFAGWVYDRYNPKLLRPTAMLMIAGGFLVLGLFARDVELWMIPILMLPISVGSSIFNPINNATVMSSLPLRHRGIASGMLETTREMGHAFGGTVSATALAMVLPAGIAHLTSEQASAHYFEGFVFSCLLVVFVMVAGGLVAYFHKSAKEQTPPSQPRPSYESAGADD